MLLRLSAAGLLALVVTGTALGDPSDPRQHLTKAGQARAAGTLLVRADLGPAWSGGAIKPSSFKSPKCPASSPNDSDLTLRGHAEARFTIGSVTVDSDVEVFATSAQAAKRFDRILQPTLGTCLRYDLAKSVAGSGVSIGSPRPLRLAKVAPRFAAFRVPLQTRTNGGKLTLYSDYLFLARGASQIYVNVISGSTQGRQVTDLEARLARVLAGRAGR